MRTTMSNPMLGRVKHTYPVIPCRDMMTSDTSGMTAAHQRTWLTHPGLHDHAGIPNDFYNDFRFTMRSITPTPT